MHILWLVTLEELLLILHDIGKVLSSTVERWAVQIILLLLLAFVISEDLVARFGTLCKNHLTVDVIRIDHQWMG